MSTTDKPKRPSFRDAFRAAREREAERAPGRLEASQAKLRELQAADRERKAEKAARKAEKAGPNAPVKRGLLEPRVAFFAGEDGHFTLYKDGLDHAGQTFPLDTIREVRLEDGEALQSRITATRLVLVGVFALAFKKKRGGEKFLTVETDSAFAAVKVNRKKVNAAQRFAAEVRNAAKSAAR